MNNSQLLKINGSNTNFIDKRKAELEIFDKLKDSGLQHLALIKSPTEKIMFVWLSLYLFEALMRDCPGRCVKRVVPQMGITPDGGMVYPPYGERIKYKIDFLVVINDQNDPRYSINIAVELDGHDYHSSKSQKKYDEERNRFLTAFLILPLHFPASVVQEDPKRVIDQILYVGKQWSQKLYSIEIP